MAAGSIAAGLVDGFARGYGLSRQFARDDEDRKDREEERAARKAARERAARQQADEDAVTEALKGVKRDVSSYGPSAEDSDMYGPQAGELRQVPRSQRDILADQARAVAGIGGLRGAQLGLQFQQGVDQLDEVRRQRQREAVGDARQAGLDREAATDRDARRAREAIADRQSRVLEGMRQARLMVATPGNDPQRLAQAVSLMRSIYEGVPDGRQLIVQDGTMGVAGTDGKWVHSPVPITRENVEAALDYAERYLDPNWATRQQAVTNDAYRTNLAANATRDQNRQDRQLDAQIRGGYFNQRPASAAGENVRLQTAEDGTIIAVGRDGKPLHNIIAGGMQVSPGITETMWQRAQREAATAGVRAVIGQVGGRDRIAYQGRDGQFYDSAAEAAKAKAAPAR